MGTRCKKLLKVHQGGCLKKKISAYFWWKLALIYKNFK